MKAGPLVETYRNTVRQFGEYSGFELPAEFSSQEREFDAAVLRSALFDHSFAGRIEIRGADAIDFLHRLSTNDLLGAKSQSVVGTVFTNEKGRVVDYATVALAADRLLMVVSPGNEGLVLSWLEKYHITEDIQFKDVTAETAMASLLGPEARTTANRLLNVELSTNQTADVKGEKGMLTVICAETSRLPMVHVVGPPEAVAYAWNGLTASGEPAIPMGYEAFEAYRISRGVPRAGAELTTAFNPYEIGLREAISFSKGCYIGQEVIARLETYQKIQRKLVGLASSAPFTRGEGMAKLFRDTSEVGIVTSAASRPVHGRYVGLGVVSADAVHEGDGLETRFDGRSGRATVLHIPMLIQGASVA